MARAPVSGPIDWRPVPETPDSDDLPAPRRATPRARRARFALPADHHDDRVSERIEAFLEGPSRRRRAGDATPAPAPTPRRSIPLDTRTDWEVALRHEDARTARYGRPCAVLVVEVRDVPASGLDRVATVLASVIRQEARETDRVARIGPARFHVLLPETTSTEAEVLSGRIRHAAGIRLPAVQRPTLVTMVGAPRRGEALSEALARAVAALADEPVATAWSTA